MNEHCVYRSNEKEKPFQSIWTCLFVAPYTATERHFDKLEEEEKKEIQLNIENCRFKRNEKRPEGKHEITFPVINFKLNE